MNPEDLQREIEAQERWLAQQKLDSPAAPDLAQIKRQVRVALGETWLSSQLQTPPVGQALEIAKARVREELSEAAGAPSASVRRSRWRIYGLMPVLAAAAVLLVAVGLRFWSEPTPAPKPAPATELLADLAEVMQRDFDEDEQEWTAIDAELTDLETTLVRSVSSTWSDTTLEALDEEIDDLMLDMGLSSGV